MSVFARPVRVGSTRSLAMVITALSAIALAHIAPMAPPVAAADVDRVAIVTPASRTNQGWDQQGVTGLEAVGQASGVDVSVAENAGYDDITPILQDLGDDGADLLICHASGYQSICPEFAASSGIPVAVIENPGAVSAGLVSDIETQAQEAAYLAGVAAGMTTTTGVVAIVVSGEPPTWNFMTVGFAEGIHSVRPDATLLYQVIGEAAYDDAPNAKRVTESVIAANADIVFGMGDGASFGMIQAVNEHNAAGQGQLVRFIDVIGDKTGTDSGQYLLTSVVFDYRAAYTHLIDTLRAEGFGDVYTMNLANGGVRLLPLSDGMMFVSTPGAGGGTAVASPASGDVLGTTAQAIIDGRIKVSTVGDADGVHQRLDELFPR